MIGLITHNPDTIFFERLNLPVTIITDESNDEISGLFIDWVPKISAYEGAWMNQASLLQKYIKSGIPIIIFDRLLSLTEKEVNWVKRFNTYLFEPALNSGRSGFNYLPEWIHNFDVYEDEDEDDDRYDIVYYHHRLEYNLEEFEKWIKDYSRLFPDKKVAYSSDSISDFKKEEFKRDNLIFLDDNPMYNMGNTYKMGNTTIAIDTKKSYEIGYFNPMYFFAMNLGCLPLLPVDHKYFHSMFKGLIINDIRDMDFYVSLFSDVKYVVIEEIFDRIKREWSEFTIDHAVDVVRKCYE